MTDFTSPMTDFISPIIPYSRITREGKQLDPRVRQEPPTIDITSIPPRRTINVAADKLPVDCNVAKRAMRQPKTVVEENDDPLIKTTISAD